METELKDAPPVSSPENEGAERSPSPPVVEAASTTDDAEAASSTEATPEKSFANDIERLESGESPTKVAKAPEAEATEQDEPVVKAEEAPVLSQAQEQALNKAFDERPEWKAILSATPKDKQKEVRGAMRGIFEREGVLNSTLERVKPAVEKFERLRRGVGDDQAVENTIQLVELFQQGNPKARDMLITLLNDLDARTGMVLTSPDLIKRGLDIEAQLTDGSMDEAQAKQARADLLELQKSRVGKQQSEAERQRQQEAETQRSFETQQTEMVNAADAWEKTTMAKDPDYPALKPLVEDRAYRIGNERQNKLKGRLLNGAEMKQVLDDALKQIKEEAGKLQPKPKPRQVLNGNGSSATSRRQPANEREAFEMEIERLEAKRR